MLGNGFCHFCCGYSDRLLVSAFASIFTSKLDTVSVIIDMGTGSILV